VKKYFAFFFIFFLSIRFAFGVTCLSCHVLKGWEESQHARILGVHQDRACLMCHTLHPIPPPANLSNFAYLRSATIGGVTAVHNVCFRCHTSGEHHPLIKAPDIYDQFNKENLGGSAMPLIFTGHKPFLGKVPMESLLLGSKPDELPHIECTDCHNPHFCNREAPLRGARGIDIHGNPINPLGDAQDNLQTPHDYEICFRCHGDTYQEVTPFPAPPYPYSLRPPTFTNKRAEFDPDKPMNLQPEIKNSSFHPVVYPGLNHSKALEEQLSQGTNGKLHVTSVIRCEDCHNNDAFANIHGPLNPLMGTYQNPEGPHGSLNKRILRAYYSFQVGTDTSPPFSSYNPKNFQLCFDCHDEKAFDGGPRNTETNFYSKRYGNLHYLHLTGEGGKLPAYESCMECHYNVHSNVYTDTTLFLLKGNDKDTHLLWFYPGVKGLGNNRYPVWTSTPEKKSCAMVCHAHVMNYHYGGP
jgi:hypothetical protein